MKPALLLAASLVLAPYALSQTAVAGNNLTQVNKPVIKAPAKPSAKPAPPSTKKPSPSPAKPSNSLSSSNQNQNANSNANANGNSNTNKAAGGTSIAGGGSAQGGSAAGGSASSGSNSVDSSDHAVSNTNVHELFIPPVVPPTPPSTLAVGNVESEVSACGPLQSVVKIPVSGTFHGLFKQSKVSLGFTEELAPYLDKNGDEIQYKQVVNPDGSTSYYGHQVITHTAILGTSGARNLALGGGGGSGSWGQGGLGSSSSNQQLVSTIILRLCEAERIQPVETQTVQAVLPDAPVPNPPNGGPVYGLITTNLVPAKPHKVVHHHRHTTKLRKDCGCGLTVVIK